MARLRCIIQILINMLLICLILLAIAGFSILQLGKSAPANSNFQVLDNDRLFSFKKPAFEYFAARSLLNGDGVYFGQLLANERHVDKLYIKNMPYAYDVAVLGSSHIAQLDSNMLGVDSFHNYCYSGADLRDIINCACMLVESGNAPKYMVIELGPWLLNPSEDAISSRSDYTLYFEAIKLIEGKENNFNELFEDIDTLDNMKENIGYFYRDINDDIQPEIVSGDLNNLESDLKSPEGNIIYDINFRNVDNDTVSYRALVESPSFMRMAGFVAPDDELVNIFTNFIDYLTQNKVEVIFCITPYHPITYNYVSERKNIYPGFFTIEEWFVDFAKSKDISLYGSYNPNVAGLFDVDFYDSMHLNADGLAKILPQLDVIKMQQAQKRGYSAYHLTEEKVTAENAVKFSEKKYVPAEGQVHRAIGNIEVFGKDCHYIVRMSGSSKSAKAVSEYAVSKSDGAVYAFVQGEWIYDFLYNSAPDRTIP